LKNEIILYHPDNQPNLHVEVKVEDETVWLTQAQMVELFDATKQNISLHIKNIYKDEELLENATVKDYLTVQKEGSRSIKRKVRIYNLDVIISVGYRVKSKRGTQFRIWANSVLKDYLLKGYAVNHRMEQLEKKVMQHDKQIELLINTSLPPNEGIFYDGQIFDAYQFVSELIKSAKKSVILVYNYMDESVLMLLSKRNNQVKATVYTDKIDRQLQLDIEKHNKQYPIITIKLFKKSHDRFLIIDQNTVYHIGASLKDLGKKWFAFSKMKINALEIINKLVNA
jgi:prophage antirepressor-like protein